MRTAVLALCLAPLIASASEPSQAFVSLTVLKDGVALDTQGFVASQDTSFYSGGTQNGYTSVSCEKNTATVRSLSIFSGITVSHRLTAQGVEVKVNRYAVDAPPVASVDPSRCKPVSPTQKVLLANTSVLPLAKTGEVALENSYSLRYVTSPEG